MGHDSMRAADEMNISSLLYFGYIVWVTFYVQEDYFHLCVCQIA